MSAVWLALAALTVACWAAWRAHRYRQDIHDQIWADDTVAWLRSMRHVDFDDHCDQALAVVADEVAQRRLARDITQHPAGGQR
jgi:hypothetical protein